MAKKGKKAEKDSIDFGALEDEGRDMPDSGEIELLPLPDREAPEYIDCLIYNVVKAFTVFLSDNMALDYCEVEGKDRQRVLKHKDYKTKTRLARAKKYLAEIKEIENISKALGGMEVSADNYDMRDAKMKQAYDRDAKDLFGMKLKAAEMRRSVLSLSREDEAESEAEALNIYFTPVTREEWERLATTEVFEGTEDGDFGDEEEIGGIAVNGLSKKLMEQIAEEQEKEAEGGFKVNADGTVEDY